MHLKIPAMAIFTEQNFIERCHDVLANTNVLTPSVLVEQLRKSVRIAVGLEPDECIDTIDAERYSRMERHLLDTVRVVGSYSNEPFDVLAVINNHLLNKELIEAQTVD